MVEWLCERRLLELGRRRWHVHDTRQPDEFVGYRATRGGLVPAAKVLGTRHACPESSHGSPTRAGRAGAHGGVVSSDRVVRMT